MIMPALFRRGLLAGVVLAALLNTGCGAGKPAATDAKADAAAIRQLLADVGRHFDAGDYEAMLALYTDDVIVTAPGTPDAIGKAAWRKGIETTLPQGVKMKLRFDTQEIEIGGDLAYERGTFVVEALDSAGAPQPVAGGRHIHIFKRQADGSWKGWRLMENSADPAPPAAPPAAAAP
jgi:uncharacterized protein (TIGR02246 family)